MFCRSCQYELAGLVAGRCPECGRPFDPSDRSTFETRRRGAHAIIGFGLALVIGIAGLFGLRAAYQAGYGDSHQAAFLAILGIGLAAGLAAGFLAAWNRSWLGRVPLLLVGVLCVWLGLFLGSEKYFRVWQSIPNPPDEAYADTAPMGAFLLGWFPGAIVVGAAFGLGLLVFDGRRRRGRSSPPRW
ncbi:MAG: RING finger protein [Planctomycetota bacterium]|jgi:hypothetical protein